MKSEDPPSLDPSLNLVKPAHRRSSGWSLKRDDRHRIRMAKDPFAYRSVDDPVRMQTDTENVGPSE